MRGGSIASVYERRNGGGLNAGEDALAVGSHSTATANIDGHADSPHLSPVDRAAVASTNATASSDAAQSFAKVADFSFAAPPAAAPASTLVAPSVVSKPLPVPTSSAGESDAASARRGVVAPPPVAANPLAPTSATLYHISGSIRHVVETKLDPVSASLNEDDAFILDAGHTIYVFLGASSSPGERAAAGRRAAEIEANRPQADLFTVTSTDAPADFWTTLGGKAGFLTRTL